MVHFFTYEATYKTKYHVYLVHDDKYSSSCASSCGKQFLTTQVNPRLDQTEIKVRATEKQINLRYYPGEEENSLNVHFIK